MIIDDASRNLIIVALYINNTHPGFISELWIEKSLKSELTIEADSLSSLPELIEKTNTQISQVIDPRRKKYLKEIFNSIIFQANLEDDKNIPFKEFSRKVFGFEIKRITQKEIDEIQSSIKFEEKKLNVSIQEVYEKNKVPKDLILRYTKEFVTQSKKILPNYITEYPDKGFLINSVTNKPWSAFNSHISPFKSTLNINIDFDLCTQDLFNIAFHEGYGGHHSELSQKDKLLLAGNGEHGLVITFSPQAFISEALAEGVSNIYGRMRYDPYSQLIHNYDLLTFALQNLATHLFFEDKLSKEEIREVLDNYYLFEKTKESILAFSTDNIYGRYAPIYFSALKFFEKLYSGIDNKEALLRTLFTKTCTPSLVEQEFGV